MSEIVTSITNRNSMLYGISTPIKNEGPACVKRKGEDCGEPTVSKPTVTPIKAVREK